jgi:hypothetical protein
VGGGTFRAAAQIGRHCLPQRGRNVLTAPGTPVNPPKQHDFRIMVRIAAGSTLHRLAARTTIHTREATPVAVAKPRC